MPEEAVRRANTLFYEAFERRDLRAMAEIWEQSERVFCVHPGWPMLLGWSKVLPSWYGLFSNAERLQFVVVNDIVHVHGDCAWVSCEENLLDVGPEGGVSTINYFVRSPGDDWLMVGHVAAPMVARRSR